MICGKAFILEKLKENYSSGILIRLEFDVLSMMGFVPLIFTFPNLLVLKTILNVLTSVSPSDDRLLLILTQT